MIVGIGDIVIDKINTLPWLDKYAGIVKNLSYLSVDKEGKKVKKTFPASCRMTWEECEAGQDTGRYKDLIPDSSKKSLLYLEDKGVRFLRKEGRRYVWRASMNMVGWLNLPKLGSTSCSYSSIALTGILSKLPETPFNVGNYQMIQINAVGQEPKTNNPFAKFSYDETIQQFLMYPYDYFVLLIEVEFSTNKACLTAPSLGPDTSCENTQS